MSEKLSHRTRRDIRRSFGLEAAAEVTRFVEHCEQEFDLKAATVHNEIITERTRIDALESLLNSVAALTFWQRLRWLVRGTWAN